MKTPLLLLLFLSTLFNANAQVKDIFPNGFSPAAIPARTDAANGSTQSSIYRKLQTPSEQHLLTIAEEKIGETFYDLQANHSMSRRLTNNGDGTLSACWSYSPNAIQGPSPFPDLRTGYSYFDGTVWDQSGAPNMMLRTNFPNLIVCRSGAELTIQHTGTEMALFRRPVKGTGPWTLSYPWGNGNSDTWAKAANAGDTVHAIWHGTGTTQVPVAGQDGPVFYSHSYDAGITWSPKQIISLIDSSHYLGFGSENYMIDADGYNVAIVFGSMFTDLGILKSTDAGQTWTKKIIRSHPIPMFDHAVHSTDTNNDGIADTLLLSRGNETVLIDHQGNAHVWFGAVKYYGDTIGLQFLPYDGLHYWNESMPTNGDIRIATAQDFNGNGILDLPLNTSCSLPYGDYRNGITEMPSAGIDANGTIYVTYQTINEVADTQMYSQAHKHVYMITLPGTAGTYNPWNYTYPVSLVPSLAQGGDGEYQEAVFASMARLVDPSFAYVLYQRDPAPGHALSTDTCGQWNNLGNFSDLIFSRIDVTTTGLGYSPSGKLFVSQNYPNPCRGVTFIQTGIKDVGELHLVVSDARGIIVSERLISVSAGSQTIPMETSDLSPGIYFYSLTMNGESVTRRMIKL